MSGLTGNNILAGSSGQGGYEIEQSLRFDDGDSAYMSRTPAGASNRKTWTISTWVKIANLASTNSSPYNLIFSASGASDQDVLYFESDDTLVLGLYASDPTVNMRVFQTTQLFRDVSAWYHIVVSCDTTAGSNYVKLYINGEEVTDFSTDNRNNAALSNHNTEFNNTYQHRIGKSPGSDYLSAYLAEFNWIDGQALTPSDFGETDLLTNQWIAKKYVGTYGTNGFYLNFSDSASLGADSSGNGNNFTPTNLAATDQVLDSPTNNFATLNLLAPPRASGSFTYSEGNLKVSMGGSGDADCPSTMGASSGKWYAEAYILTGDQSTNTPFVGLVSSKFLDDETIASSSNSCVYYYSGSKRVNGTVSSYGATYNSGDIVGIAFNADDNEVTFYKNNSTQGAISLTADEYVFSSGKSAGTPVLVWNFGQDSSFAGNKTAQNNTDANGIGDFYHAPPSGYLALCEYNLSNPSIALPGEHFNTVIWSGNGTGQSITGVGFQPDFVWMKQRSNANDHALVDAVRGVLKGLSSNSTASENTFNHLTAFNTDGFSVGTSAQANSLGSTYVAWNWKADNTSGSSNTDGTITSTVSANPTAGFSIVSYTGNGTSGATVGHGLSIAPSMVIVKIRNTSNQWDCFHESLGATKHIYLNLTNAAMTNINRWNNTSPSSSVVTLGDGFTVNQNTSTYIAYCFAEVEGYNKFGSYTGNGSADGVFVYTGFRPAFVLFKRSDASGNYWTIRDTARNPSNESQLSLYPNVSDAEATSSTGGIDILSNGFKLRGAASDGNTNGGTYIYMAFAESPFKYSNAR